MADTTGTIIRQTDTAPHGVDLHVGGRVRLRRKLLGMSQENLAEAIDLTFQQVQKYERGSNRISCSKLFEIATALKTTPQYFFEGYGADQPIAQENGADAAVHGFLMTTDGIDLALSFPKIADAKTRRRILELVSTLAGLS